MVCHIVRPCPLDWKKKYTSAWSSKSVQGSKTFVRDPGKLSHIHFNVLLFSNPAPVFVFSTEQFCPDVSKHFWTLSAGLDNNGTLAYIFESFSGPWTCLLPLANCGTPIQCFFLQTRCSQGSSTNSFVTDKLINWASDAFPPDCQNSKNPTPLQLQSWFFKRMFTTHHVSCVTCHLSYVTCHVSPVTCHKPCVTSHMYFFLWKNKYKLMDLVCGGCFHRGLPCLVSCNPGVKVMVSAETSCS